MNSTFSTICHLAIFSRIWEEPRTKSDLYLQYTTEEIARRGHDTTRGAYAARSNPSTAFWPWTSPPATTKSPTKTWRLPSRLLKRLPDALLYGQPFGEPGRPSARIGGALPAASPNGRRSVTVSVNEQLTPTEGAPEVFEALRRAEERAVCAALADR